MNIFEIQKSKDARDFVYKNGVLEFEAFAEIMATAVGLPYLSALFKLGKVFGSYMDFRFVQKLSFFLEQSEKISDDRKERFFNSLSQEDYKKISSYLTQLLYTAEEDAKATLMG